MRLTMSLLGFAAAAILCAAPVQQAAADGMKDHRKASAARKGEHHRHQYTFEKDPYVYRYSPRGYYPYYNSGHWAPARYVRERAHMHYYHWIEERPPYFQSWGHPRKEWHNRAWHAEHHGYIRRHHW
jgi:hypothetical protein